MKVTAAVVVVLTLTACDPSQVSRLLPTPSPTLSATSAYRAAAKLTVKGRAPMTGYSRDKFGPAWADVDHNGCDTRNDTLHRDLTREKLASDHCTVLAGTLRDPYTGTIITFTRGRGTSSKVQIDHVVALGDAWQTGAQQWTASRREQFANDPANLLAVDGPANEAKGDSDAASWLPPDKSYRCKYVARQVGVKRTYGLWVTAAEQQAMLKALIKCPRQKIGGQ